MNRLKEKVHRSSLLNRKAEMILCGQPRCSISTLAVNLAAIQQLPRSAFCTPFLFLLLFDCKFILTEDLLVTSCWHFKVIALRKTQKRSKQASVFQQVTRRIRSHTQITKKRKGVGLGEWRPDIFKEGGNPLTKSDLDRGYFSQLLVIPGAAKQEEIHSPARSCHVILWNHATILIPLIISGCNNKKDSSA